MKCSQEHLSPKVHPKIGEFEKETMTAALPEQVPNNIGPTLLMIAGLITAPLGVGAVLVIAGLATLRSQSGRPSFPKLREAVAVDHFVQFWGKIKP